MGLFNNLFGSSSKGKEQETKVRAQFKNEKYFKNQIARCDMFIESDRLNEIGYLKTHNALKDSHYMSNCSIRNKKIETLYSIGANIQDLIPIFRESLDNFLQGFSDDFKNNTLTIQILSFIVLLNMSEKDLPDLTRFIEKWEDNNSINDDFKPCSLVYYFINNKKERKVYEPFDMLYNITQLPKEKAEEAIKEYLDKWYEMHKDEPWYNTHLREKGYSGYWAWEVGAVVKKMNLDDNSFKDHPFYPYDMVHWQENKK